VFAKLFRKKPTSEARAPLVTDDEIPRYPPFAKGLPAAQTSRIIQTQQELITRIRGALRFNQSEFDQLVLPVIERYAAYVHLLPASETHHHRGAGGLFRHGLEVGFWSAQRAESHQFCLGETPKNRRDNEPRWQFASFLGGLLHDVGKPLSDVAVTDETGAKEWNPYDLSLAEWSQREEIDRYFLRWRDKRKKRHEKFSMMNLDQIITPMAKSYLNKPGPHIMESLLESIVGTGASEALTQIVLWADQESVRLDLINQRLDVDEHAYGVPVERFIFDAIRRLVPLTNVNEPGSTIWRLEQGVFLAWNQIVPEIHNLIERDKIPGVPRNPDTLADILIERGFATPYQENSEAKPIRYWRIYPDILKGVPLNCLRFDDLELIFTSEPPAPAKASFTSKEEEEKQNNAAPIETSTLDIPSPGTEADYYSWEQIDDSSDFPPPMPDEVISSLEKGRGGAKPKPSSLQPKHQGKKIVAGDSPGVNQMAKIASEIGGNAGLSLPLFGNKKNEMNNNRAEKTVAKSVPEASIKGEPKAIKPKASQKKENSNTKGWKYIYQAIRSSNSILETLPGGRYGIPHPASSAQLGEPKDVMNILSDEGLLHKDQMSTSKTSQIGGKRYLVLSVEVSHFIHKHLGEGEEELEDSKPGGKPSIQTEDKEKKDTEKQSSIKTISPQKKEIKKEGADVPLETTKKRLTKERYKLARKIPSEKELEEEFIRQMLQGFGPYIEGEVISEEVGSKVTYRVSKHSIRRIAKKINSTESVVRTLLRKSPFITFANTHQDSGTIDLEQEL